MNECVQLYFTRQGVNPEVMIKLANSVTEAVKNAEFVSPWNDVDIADLLGFWRFTSFLRNNPEPENTIDLNELSFRHAANQSHRNAVQLYRSSLNWTVTDTDNINSCTAGRKTWKNRERKFTFNAEIYTICSRSKTANGIGNQWENKIERNVRLA